MAALMPHNRTGKSVMQIDTQALRNLCIQRKAIPHEFFIDVMQGNMKCRTCKGLGLKRYRLSERRQAPCTCEDPVKCWRCAGTGKQLWNERVCQSCRGDGEEVVSPETSLNAAKYLAPYISQQLKQVDHVSSDGSRVTGIRIIAVAAQPAIETGAAHARLMAPDEGGAGD